MSLFAMCLYVFVWNLTRKQPVRRPDHNDVINTNGVNNLFSGAELELRFSKQRPNPSFIVEAGLRRPSTSPTSAIKLYPNQTVESDVERRLPSVLIIGAAKCGTSALRNFLNVHPSIVAKLGAEMQFFNGESYQDYDLLRSLMPPSRRDQLTLAKCAGYLYMNRVPDRIRAFDSSIKLLLILRDPVVRTLSIYGQKVAEAEAKNKTMPSFEEIILRKDANRINKTTYYITSGNYQKYIKMWYSSFSKDQILILDGDLMIRDPYQVLRDVELFLGISPYFSRDMFNYNEDKQFFCRLDSHGVEKCMGDNKGRKHEHISDDLQYKLIECFRLYNGKLLSLTGQSYSWMSKYGG